MIPPSPPAELSAPASIIPAIDKEPSQRASSVAVTMSAPAGESREDLCAFSLSLLLIPRFVRVKACSGRGSVHMPQVGNFDGKWNRPRNISKNNMLRGRFDHICVLFVQHPSENKRHGLATERSVVVCARTFGNCD